MTKKMRRNPNGACQGDDEIEALYQELLVAFYEDENVEAARAIASRLEAALSNRPEVADSIRAEEIRSITAELQGDLAEAIRYRQREIRMIHELHRLTQDTAAREYVMRQYDYSDLSDRLDLLAILYADQGDYQRAVSTLQESKQLCESHQIEFDGQDLLDEFSQAEARSH
jgi:hypothetical protein